MTRLLSEKWDAFVFLSPGATGVRDVTRRKQLEAERESLLQRERAARDLARLPEPLRRLEAGVVYPVQISAKLKALVVEMDAKARG